MSQDSSYIQSQNGSVRVVVVEEFATGNFVRISTIGFAGIIE